MHHRAIETRRRTQAALVRVGPSIEQRRDQGLRESACVQVRGLGVELDALDECAWASGPAEADATRQELGERVEAQHATVNVH